MKARFPGKCSVCGLGIAKDEECSYDRETGTIRHPLCYPVSPSSVELADLLGFVPHDELMARLAK